MNLLDDTEDHHAIEWREKCREKIQTKKSSPSLSKLPIGAVIEFDVNGKTYRLEKHAPAYQFKTPFWWNGINYYKKKEIPENFRVIEA